MQMSIDQILDLHKKTKGSIVNKGPAMDAEFPCTMEYPTLRGKTVAITWTSREEYWTARQTIIVKGQQEYNSKNPTKGRSEGQRRWIATAIRMGWI